MTYVNPVATDTSLYPAWWAAATTVELMDIREATASFSPSDCQFFPYGVTFPSTAGANVFIPWTQVQSITQTA